MGAVATGLRSRLPVRSLADYAMIALGAVLVAASADMFLIPNRVVSGGLTGVSTVLFYLIGTPVGLVTFLLNVPLFLADVRWGGGWRAGLKTAFAVTVMSAAIDLLKPYLPQATADRVLYTVYGGLMDGLGLGLVFRAGGTTGGTDIIASLARRFLGVKLGHTLLAANVVILGSAALFFGPKPAMYALLLAFVSSQVIDVVQEGLSQSRSTTIISRRADAVRAAIMEQMERGVTVLHGEGGYTAEPLDVLLCAVPQAEVSRLKRLIQEIDPDAFVIVAPAGEVLGEGFRGLSAP